MTKKHGHASSNCKAYRALRAIARAEKAVVRAAIVYCLQIPEKKWCRCDVCRPVACKGVYVDQGKTWVPR